jgi:carbamoyl-phosphate synthase small subunit
MVGYGETMTDPSYEGQILCFTYPMIGNYGVPKSLSQSLVNSPFESWKIHVRGLILSEYSEDFSHWSARISLHQWMQEQNIPGISGIDTRALTILLRDRGSMLGSIVQEAPMAPPLFQDPNQENLAAKVTSPAIQVFLPEGEPRFTLLLIDCGSKSNILRSLLKRGVKVVSVPYDYDFLHPRFLRDVCTFDGIIVSNGPGNPELFEDVVLRLRKIIEDGIPTMGICLGHQLIARAAGAKTFKLKFGHRSHNQPCMMEGTERCFITSQNHGYAVDIDSLPTGWKPFFTNLNDGTNEGIKHEEKPIFSVQFHPEAAPGPQDTRFLFDDFLEML